MLTMQEPVADGKVDNAFLKDEVYRCLFDQSIYINIFLDLDFNIVLLNKNAEANFPDFFTNKPTKGKQIFEFLEKEDSKRIEKYLKKSLEGEFCEFERKFSLSGSKSAWGQIYVSPVFDQLENISGILVKVKNINERKEKEQSLTKAKLNAEKLVSSRLQFMANLSHEIRTPLNGIIGISNILLQREPKTDQIEFLNSLKFSSEQLLGLVNEVLDFSKLEAGKIELHEKSFDFKKLCVDLINSFSVRASEKNIKVSLNFLPGLPIHVYGDELKLTMVLTNLISNAIKFTLEGDVLVEISLESQNDNYSHVLIKVKDTGIGIAPEKLDKIFESYSQAAQDTTEKFGGTGLGLSISQKLLKIMGSKIFVKSQLGEGSEFYFSLKFKKNQELEELPLEKSIKKFGGMAFDSIKLLLVEDNDISRFVTVELLKDLRIFPDVAQNGLEAYEKIKSNFYDVVLMDIQMPEMDGFETTMEVRKLDGAYFKNLPIIALTADIVAEIQEKGLVTGMTDFITKPFTYELLLNKLNQVFKNKISPSVNQHPNDEGLGDINQIIIDICRNDPEQIHELQKRLIKYLMKLPLDFKAATLSKKLDEIISVRHAFKPTGHTFKLFPLLKILDVVDHFNTEKIQNKEVFEKSIHDMEIICSQLIDTIKKSPYYLNKD